LRPGGRGGEPGRVFAALLLAGSLVPLIAMLVALFVAAWLRSGARLEAARLERLQAGR